MSILRFIAVFLATFALLIVAGAALNATKGYATLLEKAVSAASPAVNGWWIESRDNAEKRELWLRRESTKIKLQISLEKLGLGLFPLLALLIATPGLGWKRHSRNIAIGVVALFALDLAVLLAYPWLVTPSAAGEITGTFLGLLTFVGAPVILWFMLTFRHLRPVWRLGEPKRGDG